MRKPVKTDRYNMQKLAKQYAIARKIPNKYFSILLLDK